MSNSKEYLGLRLLYHFRLRKGVWGFWTKGGKLWEGNQEKYS